MAASRHAGNPRRGHVPMVTWLLFYFSSCALPTHPTAYMPPHVGILSSIPPILPTHMTASRHSFVSTKRKLPHVQECCAGKHARQPRSSAAAGCQCGESSFVADTAAVNSQRKSGCVQAVCLRQGKSVPEESRVCTLCPDGANTCDDHVAGHLDKMR